MTRFVTRQNEFAAAMESLGTVLRLDATFPAAVLNRVPAGFALFSDTLVFTGSFDEILEGLSRVSDGLPMFFASLSPDPVGYFFEHFGKYPLIRFDERVDGDEFRKPLNEDPGGSPADALIVRTERFAIFPRDLDWIIYADRDFELAIVAAFAKETSAQVMGTFPADTLFDVEGALQDLLQPVYRGSVPAAVKEQLLRNYSSIVTG